MRGAHVGVFLSALLFSCTAGASDTVRVRIDWVYKDLSSRIEMYEVKGHARLWDTRSVKNLDMAPVAGKIESPVLTLGLGSSKRFVLVMRNETNKPIYFFAAPHHVQPVEYSLGFKFKCLCINHAFTVGSGETWYRVVELRVSDGIVGDMLTITHALIGIDQNRADAFSREHGIPEM